MSLFMWLEAEMGCSPSAIIQCQALTLGPEGTTFMEQKERHNWL